MRSHLLHLLTSIFALLTLALFFSGQQAQAQAWCADAASKSEKTICSNADLGVADVTLARAYSELRGSQTTNEPIVDLQRAFLKARNACGSDVACLQDTYSRQIDLYRGLLDGSHSSTPETVRDLQNDPINISAIDMDFTRQGAGRTRADALLVANFNYETLADLDTPESDATLVSAALGSRGVKAQVLSNGNRAAVFDALRGYEGRQSSNDLFVLYYAGHAATLDGQSALMLPNFAMVDGIPNNEVIPIAEIVNEVASLGYKKVLIVFDACRSIVNTGVALEPSNEGSSREHHRGPTVLMSRSAEMKALDGVDYAISFSAAEGSVALDSVNGINSPFAQAFSANVRSNDTILSAMIETRRQVRDITDDFQRPTLEMSWNEDYSLRSLLVGRIDYQFWESMPLYIDHPGSTVQPDPSSYDGSSKIAHTSDVGDKCSSDGEIPNSAFFAPWTFFDCLKGTLGITAPSADGKTKEVNFGFGSYAQDSIINRCQSATLTTDLDANGQWETVTFGHNRNGGELTIERNGHTSSFYSQLGCSFTNLWIYDIDAGGVADLIVEYDCSEEHCLAVIGGERLMTAADGDQFGNYDGALESGLAKYFARSEYMSILAGLGSVTLFYDANIKGVRLLPDRIEYVTYSGTWERPDIPTNVMPDKVVRIRSDGSVSLESDGVRGGLRYRLSPLKAGKVALERLH